MNVKELLDELKKLPPQAELCDVRLLMDRHEDETVRRVVWQGNHTTLENR